MAEKYRSESRFDEALAQLQDASRFVDYELTRNYLLIVRASIREETGDLNGAISSLDEMIRTNPAYVQTPSPFIFPYFYNLGRLQEATGDLAGAKRNYERFLSYWGSADIPISAVADAEAGLARVTQPGT